MSRSPVFVDTSALVALCAQSDSRHASAVRIRKELTRLKTPIVTSQWVLTEFLGFSPSPDYRALALQTVDKLLGSSRTQVIIANDEEWKLALRLYRDRADKGWSLVDCTSIRACEAGGIKRVFTSDRHFSQAGFEVLLT